MTEKDTFDGFHLFLLMMVVILIYMFSVKGC